MPYCKLCKRGFRESEFDWHLRCHLFEAYFRLEIAAEKVVEEDLPTKENMAGLRLALESTLAIVKEVLNA